MRYAIVESGGKQYRAVEGGLLEVDRLSVEIGKKLKLDRVLLAVSGDAILVGTPTLSGVSILTKVLEHFKSIKTFSFQYSPKKRIRQKTGHRQLYTRLMVETIEGVKEDLTAQKEEKVEAKAAGGTKSGRTRPQKEVKAGKPAVEEKRSAGTAKPKPAKPAAAPAKEKKPKAKPVAAPSKAKKPATSKKPAAADKTTKKSKK